MEKVQRLREGGASIPTAIKEALGMTVSEFAEKHGLQKTDLSAAINGSKRATDAMVDAFVAELGGTPDDWRMLLWEAAKPQPASA